MAVFLNFEFAPRMFRETNDACVVFEPRDWWVIEVNPTASRWDRPGRGAFGGPDLGGDDLGDEQGPTMALGRASGSAMEFGPTSADEAFRAEVAARARAELDLGRAVETAEAAGRARDRLLSALSHELRTPLTPVLAMVSSMLDGPEIPASLRPSLELIRRNVTLEARLIDDLLDATRTSRDPLKLEAEPVDALELIGQAVDLCGPEAERLGVQIVVEPAGCDHRVVADPTRFRQVVWNLLKNAVASSELGSLVVVRTEDHEGGRLGVTVADSGRGIEPDSLARIFEPFERGEVPLTGRPGALGLGLAICRAIVEGHGGRIQVESEGPGQGATFRFDVPLARAKPRTTTPSLDQPARPPSLDILLVEDNRDVLRVLKLVLEAKGHRVRAAADIASALDAIGRPFDLLISDIELPDGSGLDLMRELRGRVPGIAISGFDSPDDVRLSLDAGFARHLTKPIESRKLDEVIAEVIAESSRRLALPRAS